MENNVNKRSATWVADQGLVYWVRKDARSVHAMLCGKDDGRSTRYAAFEKKVLAKQPGLDAAEVGEMYRQHVEQQERHGFHAFFKAAVDRTINFWRRPAWPVLH